jgi:hypothetical protein
MKFSKATSRIVLLKVIPNLSNSMISDCFLFMSSIYVVDSSEEFLVKRIKFTSE